MTDIKETFVKEGVDEETVNRILSYRNAAKSYFLAHMPDLMEDFKRVQRRCSLQYKKSQQQLRSGAKPICRFCPMWDLHKQDCLLNYHLREMKKEGGINEETVANG